MYIPDLGSDNLPDPDASMQIFGTALTVMRAYAYKPLLDHHTGILCLWNLLYFYIIVVYVSTYGL